jgi:hypothetical protein
VIFHVDGGAPNPKLWTSSRIMAVSVLRHKLCLLLITHPIIASNHCIPLIQVWVGAWCDRKDVGQTRMIAVRIMFSVCRGEA